MSEVVIQRFEDEIEAETAAAMLRSQGLAARVHFRATMGMPRSVVPLRSVPTIGDYEIVVPEAEAERALASLDDAGPPSARPARYRWLAAVLIVVFIAPTIINVLIALFDRMR